MTEESYCLIILAVIGLLKLVSLFILIVLQLYNKLKGNPICTANKDYCFYITDSFYVIPTIEITKAGKYFEIAFYWLKFQYYEATKFEYEKEEK